MSKKTHAEKVTFEAQIPDGYTAVGFRQAERNERWLSNTGSIYTAKTLTVEPHIIVVPLTEASDEDQYPIF